MTSKTDYKQIPSNKEIELQKTPGTNLQIQDEESKTVDTTRHREGIVKFLQRKDVPQKAVILAICFVIIGAILFCLGFNKELKAWDPFHGFLFWVVGFILFCPGTYIIGKLFSAYTNNDKFACQRIL